MNNISKLQPLLGLDKSNPLFELLFNPEIPNEVLVHFGTALLETVQRNSFQEKLLVARLYNSGFNRGSLTKEFKYSRKAMQTWGEYLKSGKPENITKIANGQGAVKKITSDRLSYIEYLFDKYYEDKGCHINTFIVQKYKEVYRESITVESIRLCLLERRKEYEGKLKERRKNRENEVCDVGSVHASGTNTENENIPAESSAKPSELSVNSVIKSENAWKNSDSVSSNTPKNSKYSYSTDISFSNKFPLADKGPSKILSCHHVGILISRTFIDTSSGINGNLSDITRQWTAMILCNCLNIYSNYFKILVLFFQNDH